MTGESYEGWENLETHRVNLWVMNDHTSYLAYLDRLAARPFNARNARVFVRTVIPKNIWEGIDKDIDGKWFRVNWSEIADTWNEN